MLLMALWCVEIFIAYGLMVLIPLTLGRDSGNEVLLGLLIVSVVNLPGIPMNMWIIESERFGRRKTLILFELLQTISLVICVILFNSWFLIVGIAMTGFTSNTCFSTLYPYTSEIFETEIRSLSNGFFNLCARTGGVISPVLLISLNSVNRALPYVFLTILSIGAFICSMMLKVDTRRANLDTILGVPDQTSYTYEQKTSGYGSMDEQNVQE